MQGLLLSRAWLLATGHLVGATGSCWHRCCSGRNNTCWALGTHRPHCYCHSYCESMGDCCEGYRATGECSPSPFPIPPAPLAVVSCVVGPWGPWSGCSSPCRVSSKACSCQVTVLPQHDGEPCPNLKQCCRCLGEHLTCATAKGVAKILPVSFNQDFRDPWGRAELLLPEELSRWGPPATGRPGAAACTGTSGGVLSVRGCAAPQPLLHQMWAARSQVGAVWGRGAPSEVLSWFKPAGSKRPHSCSLTFPCPGDGIQHWKVKGQMFWVATSVAGCQGSWVQEGLQDGCVCSPQALIFM
ncbi:LOW QUALITY PROTEIN: somatomedin-B and thrombospondin type-1 domain-containing protein-like [Athene cunicularia]|uniref:LOW QUALITY PROTEIN: somatomedin-B and thrombospondin type-1 domain-containing protein-like n=1 Tax=Athene cunicularia TaxID=194338 RepID=UPI000EF69A25|nr:LOW QUALITY PROTEIN: somatomedin-B and thrombospondin type-1 domain-containing protein-like [Athene cunicularia]